MQKKYLFILSIFLLSTIAYAGSSTEKITRSGITELLKQTDSTVNAGIVINDLTTNTVLMQQNADRNFVPASNLKLLTAFTALLYFHPHHQFQTQLLTSGKVNKHGVLLGDLTIKFAGSPDLGAHDLTALLTRLRLLGVHHIKGNVVIDDTAFKKQGLGPGWMWDDEAYCFSAPVNSIIINHNCFNVYLHHDKWKSRRARVVSDNPYMHIQANHLRFKTTKDNCKLNIQSNPRNHYILSGCVPKKTNILELAIQHPKRYAIQLIKATLKQANIHYDGLLLSKKTPKKAHVLAKISSLPLRDLITTILKESDNLYADAIFKQTGSAYYNTTATWKSASKANIAILKRLGHINTNRINWLDGSGLSRYNLVTPNSISQLLKSAYHTFNLSAEFMAALPVNGKDGTLIHRLKQTDLAEQVRAKTGSMAHISSLSGYVQTRNHHVLSFVILINGINGSLSPYRNLEDNIVAFLARLSPGR